MLPNPKKLTIEERIAALDTVDLTHGAHSLRRSGVCAMEAAAYIAGRPHSDHPPCVSNAVGAFLRAWNDGLRSDDERNRLLKPLLPSVLNTATTAEDERTRAWLALDWLARVYAPSFLDLVPSLAPHALTLRALPALTTRSDAALAALEESRQAATAARAAAWDAAGDAARAAAGAAAWAAAWDAARAAAWDAAWDAAWAAARAAARAAAWAAAWTRFDSVVTTLQTSAADLVRAMCAVGRVQDGGAS